MDESITYFYWIILHMVTTVGNQFIWFHRQSCCLVSARAANGVGLIPSHPPLLSGGKTLVTIFQATFSLDFFFFFFMFAVVLRANCSGITEMLLRQMSVLKTYFMAVRVHERQVW